MVSNPPTKTSVAIYVYSHKLTPEERVRCASLKCANLFRDISRTYYWARDDEIEKNKIKQEIALCYVLGAAV